MKFRLLSLSTVVFMMLILVGCNSNAVSFEINFDTNGGTDVESITYDGKSTITIPDNPTKEGFIFDGWFWDNGTFLNPFTANSLLDTPIEEDLTVYAKWVVQDDELTAQLKNIYLLAVQVNAFQGTYEEWLETVRGPQGVPGEDGKSSYLRVNEGVLEWQFEGDTTWTALFDLSTLAGSDGINGKNIVLQVADGYIQWQYTGDTTWTNLVELTTLVGPAGSNGVDGVDGKQVTFQVSEGFIQWQYTGDTTWTNLVDINTLTGVQGIGIASTSINEYGELIITYTDNTVVNIGTIYKVYTVNFVGLEGYLIDSQTVIYGFDAIEPTAPIVEGYTFTGWSQTFTNITTNTSLNAIYQINTYTITFETNGGVAIDPIANIEYNSTIDLPIPTKDGYVFMGWYYGEDINSGQFTSQSIVKDNLTLYARWAVNAYTVTFDSNGGTAVESQVVEDNDKAIKPVDPTKEGYTFLGWFINGDEKWVFGGYVVTQNITLTAHWSVNSYIVTYVQNSDQEDLSLTVHPFTELIQPTKAGHMFVGWFTTIDFEENTSVDIIPADNITLYAKWEIVSYQINYVLDGGVNNVSNPNTYTIVTNTITLSDPTKEGYTFLGWYSEDTFINEVTEITLGSVDDLTLYAKWSINSYTVYNYVQPDDYELLKDILLAPEETIESISLGFYHSSALTSTGRIFTWGDNGSGQLGDGTTIHQSTPTEITSKFNLGVGETIVSISLGDSHSSALTSTGRIFTWGNNFYGQLGDGTNTNRLIPTEITSKFNLGVGETIENISSNRLHSSAITSTGRIFTWGYNGNRQLGDGTNTNRLIPTEITSNFNLGVGETIESISLGDGHSSALTSTGRIFTWGYNGYGQLGDGTNTNRSTPTEITSNFNLGVVETIESISLGNEYSSAITSTGRIFTWGYNGNGRLGDGTNTNRLIPTEITSKFNLGLGEKIESISLGFYHSSALTSTGRIFTWGYNGYGQLGDGTNTNRLIPTEITSQFNLGLGEKIESISLGGYHSSALTSTGRIFTWGHNGTSQLGDGTSIEKYTPIEITQVYYELIHSETLLYNQVITEYLTSREGYTFSGWYSDTSLTEAYTFTTMPAEDITLYAKWNIVNYQIDYVLDGGVNNVSNPISYTITTNTITLNDLFKEGYTFLGWYTEDTFINEVTEITIGSIGDITLYAQFIPYQFIEYDTYIAIIGGKTDLMPIPTMILGKPVTELYSGMYNTFGGYNPVYIPDTISYIDDTFGQYAYSSEWLVDDSNQYYTSIDGVLYTKDLSILISYPNHKIDTTFVLKPEVREIAWGAFYWNDHLLSIELNEGLEIIGAFAFMWSNLTSIHIPSTVQEIQSQAFYGKLNSWYGYEDLNYLTSVSFAENSQLTLIQSQAFRGNRIQNLVLPNSVVYIVDQAFGDYEGEIVLPTNLEYLALSAFFSVSNTTLMIPASVTEIVRPGNPYHFSENTVNFVVDTNNPNYASLDGVIYNKDFTELIAVPRGKTEIILPSTVTYIFSPYVHFWPYMTIYLEVNEKPTGFYEDWYDQATIYYANEWSYVEGVPTPNQE